MEFMIYPSYYDYIIKNILDRNWLVHNFNEIDENEVYNPATYRSNKLLYGVTYTIFLDLNIYQYILNAFKKDNPKKEFRDAIALVAFCQLSEIELDPIYAVYEKVNYRTDEQTLNETASDLELFNKINNINNGSLISYSLGLGNDIVPYEEYSIDHETIKYNLTKYRRLIEWDSLYLIVLFIIYTFLDKKLSKLEKLQKVIEWMIKEFRLSLVGITFAAIFFSENPLKKMMKYKESYDSNTKRRSAFNMTWDLYNLNRYFRMWTEKESEQENMFASGDKAFNAVLRNAIKVQQTGDLRCFNSFLSEDITDYLSKISSQPELYFKRVYMSDNWSADYRAELIKKYELLIGINEREI